MDAGMKIQSDMLDFIPTPFEDWYLEDRVEVRNVAGNNYTYLMIYIIIIHVHEHLCIVFPQLNAMQWL